MMEDIWYCICEDPIYDENGICISCGYPRYVGEDEEDDLSSFDPEFYKY